MSGHKLDRPGTMMAEDVLNPAAMHGTDGQLYLSPFWAAKGNYSRIGIAHVKFDEKDDSAAAVAKFRASFAAAQRSRC
jgi:hypothetical protein